MLSEQGMVYSIAIVFVLWIVATVWYLVETFRGK